MKKPEIVLTLARIKHRQKHLKKKQKIKE